MSREKWRQKSGWGILFFGFVLLLNAGVAFAQDYTIEEYNEYQKAMEDGEDAIIVFIKAHPQSSLKQYAIDGYAKLLNGYVQEGDYAKAATQGEKFLNDVDPENATILYLTAWSDYFSQQYDKAIKYGEKVYAAKPDDPQIVMILARSYNSSGNAEKAVEFAEKYCPTVSPEQCYDLLPTIMKYYAQKKDWATADKYANLSIKALDEAPKPAQVPDAEWQSFVNEEKSVAYTIMGHHAYETKNWANVPKMYQPALKLAPKNKTRVAEGEYFIGMAYWNQEQFEPAMKSFAKCTVLGGTDYADPCRKQLEKLYRATHNGSLAGFDEFLERAAGN